LGEIAGLEAGGWRLEAGGWRLEVINLLFCFIAFSLPWRK